MCHSLIQVVEVRLDTCDAINLQFKYDLTKLITNQVQYKF